MYKIIKEMRRNATHTRRDWSHIIRVVEKCLIWRVIQLQNTSTKEKCESKSDNTLMKLKHNIRYGNIRFN